MNRGYVVCTGCGGRGGNGIGLGPCAQCNGAGRRELDDAMLSELRERASCVSGSEVEGLLNALEAVEKRIALDESMHRLEMEGANKRANNAEVEQERIRAFWSDVSRAALDAMPHFSNSHAAALRLIREAVRLRELLPEAILDQKAAADLLQSQGENKIAVEIRLRVQAEEQALKA